MGAHRDRGRVGHGHRLEELGDAARAVRGQSKGRAAQTDYHGEEDAQQVGRTQVGRTELAEAQAEAGARRGRLRLLHGALNVRTRVRHEQARCTGKAARTEGVVDDGGASSTNALPEPTPARSSSSTSVPSRAAKPLGSTRPIGVRLLVVFLERSTRLDSPLRSILRSGEGVLHSSMPCV